MPKDKECLGKDDYRNIEFAPCMTEYGAGYIPDTPEHKKFLEDLEADRLELNVKTGRKARPTAAQIIEQVGEVLAEREGTHGTKQANMQAIADFWNVYIGDRCGAQIALDGRDVCNMMVLMKIARQMFGDPCHLDHFTDMAGYAAIGGECARAEAE